MNKMASLGRLAKFWWITAGIFALLWLGIWLIADPQAATAKSGAYTEIQTQNDLTLPKKISTLDDLSSEVSPLSVESVKQDLRSYADEFKDKAFFEKNKNKWTVQVMDSTTHENIVNYLDIRKEKYQDRDKFYYFRYVDGSSKEHYVLIYDLFPSKAMANGVWQEREQRFALPRDMEIVVKPIKEYLSLIDSYVREEDAEVKIPKEPTINLAENKKEVKPKPAKPSDNTDSQTPSEQAPDSVAPSPTQTEQPPKKAAEPKEQDKAPKAKKDDQPKAEATSETLAKPPTAKPKDAPKPELKPEPVVVETVEPDPESVVTLEPEIAEGGGQ